MSQFYLVQFVDEGDLKPRTSTPVNNIYMSQSQIRSVTRWSSGNYIPADNIARNTSDVPDNIIIEYTLNVHICT